MGAWEHGGMGKPFDAGTRGRREKIFVSGYRSIGVSGKKQGTGLCKTKILNPVSRIQNPEGVVMYSFRNSTHTIFALCTLLSALFLAGCYSYSHDVHLNRDGSGTLKVFIEHEQVSFSLKQSPKIEYQEKLECEESVDNWSLIEGVELKSCQNWIEDYRVFEESI